MKDIRALDILTEEQPDNQSQEYMDAVHMGLENALQQADHGDLKTHDEVWNTLNKEFELQ